MNIFGEDVHLFGGSVRENILLDEEALFDPSRQPPFCTEAVNRLEKQFDTQVGSDGAKLSGGEKQKVALLRALNRRAEILILDVIQKYGNVFEFNFGDFRIRQK